MNFSTFFQSNRFEKKPVSTKKKTSVSFVHLNEQEQEKLLKKGAEVFSKRFTRTIVQLAKE